MSDTPQPPPIPDAPPVPDEVKKDVPEAGGAEVGGGALATLPPKVDPQRRVLAALIDVGGAGLAAAIIQAVGMMIPLIGPLVAAVAWLGAAGYVALRDSMNDGQSLGKQQFHLRVRTAAGRAPTPQESAMRNAVLAAPFVLSAGAALCMVVPVLGWIVAVVPAGLAALLSLGGLFEAAQVLAIDPNGRRFMELKAEAYTIEE